MALSVRGIDAAPALVVWFVAVLLSASCDPPPPAVPRGADPAWVIHRVVMSDGRIDSVSATSLAPVPPTPSPVGPDTLLPAIAPVVLIQRDSVGLWMERCHKEHSFCKQHREIVVTFWHDPPGFPRLPDPVLTEPPDSPANRQALAEARAIRDSLYLSSRGRMQPLVDSLGIGTGSVRLDFVPLEYYWIASAVSGIIRVSDLDALSSDPNVRFIQSRYRSLSEPAVQTDASSAASGGAGSTAPSASDEIKNRLSTVQAARRFMGSDPYFRLDARHGTRGWIGVIDSGMRFDHLLLNDTLGQPSNIRLKRDCVNGDSTCVDTKGSTPPVFETCSASPPPPGAYNPCECPNYVGHGTSSGAIIAGNLNGAHIPAYQGDAEALRGVTNHLVDSFKIKRCRSSTVTPGSDLVAQLRGLQMALIELDKVILVETTRWGVPGGFRVAPRATDNAFDMGAVIVAPVGDDDTSPNTLIATAWAARAIAAGSIDAVEKEVGGHDTLTWGYTANSRQSYTNEGRLKPDIQTPTFTWTAANCRDGCSDTALQQFGQTSASGPYAAAAASLLRNWLVITGGRRGVDPGQVNAQLILAGRHPYPFPDTVGAGVLRLPPVDGLAWWGKVVVGHGDVIDIPLDVGAVTPDTVGGALWWPDPRVEVEEPLLAKSFNDIDLYIHSPSGQARAASKSERSVFERARVVVGSESNVPGTWTLRIIGANVPHDPQTVYWAARARLRDRPAMTHRAQE